MDKLTVRDLDAAGKRVFVRVDFNVPLADGKVTDDTRIRAAVPTIRYLRDQGAIVILASHLGRPGGKVNDTYRLRPAAERLSQLLGVKVPVTGDALGSGTVDALARLKPGHVIMLENLRFHAEEEANDPDFAKALASYADVYVNDAFGTAHRAHASTVGVAHLLPAYAGLLMEREIRALSALLEHPEKPFAAVIGGAKVSDKIQVLDNLMRLVDTFVIGGGMANTFLVAQGYTVGKSLLERERVEDAQRPLRRRGEGRAHRAAQRCGRRQGGDPGSRAQGRARPQDPQFLVRGGYRARQPGGVRDGARRCPHDPLERPPGRLRGAHLRRWDARHGALSRPARRGRRDRGRRRWGFGGCCGAARPGLEDDPHLDRRWRVPGVPRGP